MRRLKPRNAMRWISFGMLALLCSGCASSYEFDVKEPPAAAGHVSEDNDLIAMIAPLEYRLRADEGRLVMAIFNPTLYGITLVGSQSTVIDPAGVAHPLQSDSMPPHATMRIVLPPLIEPGGPPAAAISAPGPSGG